MSESSSVVAALADAARLHRRLLTHAGRTDRDDLQAVANLVAAVLMHGLFERVAVFGSVRYLSREVQEDLEREHAALLESLAVLEELDAPADADDVQTLGRALYEKALHHAERDQRIVYGSLTRLDAFRRDAEPDPASAHDGRHKEEH